MMLNADVRNGEGVGRMWTPADRGRVRKSFFLRTSFMDDPFLDTELNIETETK